MPKAIKPASTISDDTKLLLDVSKAAVDASTTSTTKVDETHKSEPIEDSTPSKAKRAKLTNEGTPTRATRSSSGQGSANKVVVELPERTVTRSATKRKSK